MKTPSISSLRLPLIAGALALVITGCGTMNRSADNRSADNRSTDRANTYAPVGYVGQSDSTAGIPRNIDPFSRGYIPFPVSTNESAGITGHSVFCEGHYNQPGCQTMDSTRGSRGMSNSGR